MNKYDFDSTTFAFGEKLRSKKLIGEISVSDINTFHSLQAVPLYVLDYKRETVDWRIGMLAGTYDNNYYQIAVSIESDTYEITIDDDYLEKLKVEIKNFFTKDFNVMWLYDEEAEFLASKLYPKIFKVENLARKFITLVLNKKYGSNWWKLLSNKVKNKHTSRIGKYRSLTKEFKDVDERLMSIDTGDLIEILELKETKWNNSKDNKEKLEILLSTPNLEDGDLIKLFNEQKVVSIDFWSDIFKEYLTEDFISDFKLFSENRNHIAHNKLIDKEAFRQIEKSIEKVDKILKKGIESVEEKILSKEEKSDQMYREMLEFQECSLSLERLRDLKQNETGVKIRNKDDIINKFNEELHLLYTKFSTEFRFIENLNFSDYCEIDDDCEKNKVFSISNKEKDYIFNFYAKLEVNEDEGEISNLHISYNKKKENINLGSIKYINGKVEFDEEEGRYNPVVQDTISKTELENALYALISSEY